MTLSEFWRNVNKPKNSSLAIRFCYSFQCCHCVQTEHFQNSVTAIRKEQEKSFDNKSAGKEAYIPEDPRENLPGLVLSPIMTLVSLHYGRYIPRLYNTLKTSVLAFTRHWIFFKNEDDKSICSIGDIQKSRWAKTLACREQSCSNILVIGKVSS